MKLNTLRSLIIINNISLALLFYSKGVQTFAPNYIDSIRFDFSMFISSLSLADSFETMLKSLLGYQSGAGMGGTEALMRKKVYEGAINKTLENNFPILLKVLHLVCV